MENTEKKSRNFIQEIIDKDLETKNTITFTQDFRLNQMVIFISVMLYQFI